MPGIRQKRRVIKSWKMNKISVFSVNNTYMSSFSFFLEHKNTEENIFAQNSDGISSQKH